MFTRFTEFDKIPQARQKDALKLEDGTYVLDTDSEELVAARTSVTNLDGTLKKVRQEKETAEAAAADARRALEAAQLSGKDGEKAITEALERWNKQKAEDIAKAVAAVRDEVAPSLQRLEVFELDNVLEKAFIDAGGDAKLKEDAVILAKARGFTRKDGKVVREINGQLQTTTPEEYFGGTFKESNKGYYVGSKADGGGSGGSGGSGGAGGPTDWQKKPTKDWTSEQRRAFIEDKGATAYTNRVNEEATALISAPVA